MNKDFESRLRDSLAEQNETIEIEGAGPAAAADRASARSQQVGLGRGVAAMFVVACLGAMAFTQFSDRSTENVISTSDEQESAEQATESPDADPSVAASTADFDAQIVDGTGQWFGRFLTDEGQLIQVTTEPGLNQVDYEDQSFVVMVSDANGIVETNDVPDGVFPNSITYHDGVLYSVSTSPKSVNNGADVIVNTTTDNGKNWSSGSIEMGPVPNSDISSVWRSTSVAASDAGVLVSVQSNFWVDFVKLLPQYSYENGNFELRQVPEGVEVRDWTEYSRLADEQALLCEMEIDTNGDGQPDNEQFEAMEECWSELDQLPEPDVIDSYTWADLGVEPIENQNISQMFLTTDGKTFEEVSTPGANASPYVIANDNGFLAEVYPEYNEEARDFEEEYNPTWFASSDGRSWNQISVPAGTCGLSSSQGVTVIAQSCNNRLQAHVSTDNGTSWTALAQVPDISDADHMTFVSVSGGDLGFVAYRNVEPDYAVVEAEFERAVHDGASDEDLALLEDELFGESRSQLDVLFSPDGQTWSSLELPEGVGGQNSWGNEAVIGKNHIVLTIGSESEDGYKVRQVFLSPS